MLKDPRRFTFTFAICKYQDVGQGANVIITSNKRALQHNYVLYIKRNHMFLCFVYVPAGTRIPEVIRASSYQVSYTLYQVILF
jgi:hypothetical protein